MATVLFFHAHPDDEAIATGGTMAKLSSEGHRVICIHATRGELGEVEDGFLDQGEALADRRAIELEAACRILGVARAEFLGYRDSDMMGRGGNDDPSCFWQADLEEAAERLAAILRDERVDVLVVYDDHGGYGHPDHIQVHRVGVRAAAIAGTPRVYEATFDRDRFFQLSRRAVEHGDIPEPPETEGLDASFGSPASSITTRVDVTPYLDQKKKAMAAHASQISETSFFLDMPDEAFRLWWGVEDYIRRGGPSGDVEDTLVGGL